LGFGAALTEASLMVLYRSPTKDQILDDLFLPPAQGGAGISCLRIPIGSSDFATEVMGGAFSYQDSAEAEFDASREERLRVPSIKEILRRNPSIALIATPWSAPAYMKTSGKLQGGSLREEYYEDYCRLLLETLLFYKRAGIEFFALTIQNEPYHETPDYPSMVLDPNQQADLANELVPLLRRNGFDTRVLGHDHNYDLVEDAKKMLKRAGGVLDGTAWHAYSGDPSALKAKEVQALGIYVTEQTGHTNRPVNADFRGDIEWMLDNVILGPVLQGARCGMAWNLALDENFGPVLLGGPKNCRGVVEVPSRGGGHQRGPEFYGLMHMSHATAVSKDDGCWRVAATSTEPDQLVVAGFTTKRSGCSVVLQNKSDDSLNVTVRVGNSKEAVARFRLPPRSLTSARTLQHLCEGIRFPSDNLRVPVDVYRLPETFALRSVGRRTCLAAHGEHSVVYQSDCADPGTWEEWTAVEESERVFVLRSCHGTYAARAADHTLTQVNGIGSATRFVIFAHRNDTVALYSDFGCVHMPEDCAAPQIVHVDFSQYENFHVVELGASDDDEAKWCEQKPCNAKCILQ